MRTSVFCGLITGLLGCAAVAADLVVDHIDDRLAGELPLGRLESPPASVGTTHQSGQQLGPG